MQLLDAPATTALAVAPPLPGVLRPVELALTDPRWREFVGRSPVATPFHHPAWATLLAGCYGYRPFALALRDEAGAIVAGLPLLDVSSPLTGHRWIALPFTDHCAPLVSDDGALAHLADALAEAQRREGLGRVEVRAPLPERPGLHLVCAAVLHTLPLTPGVDALFRSLRKTQFHRKVTKAEREGVVVRRGDSRADLETFYRLHLRTRRRQGTPIQPRRFFDALWSGIIEPGLGFVLVAHHGATPIAAALFFAHNGTVMYKYGASDTAYWPLRPNDLLMWTAIRWGCEQGYRLFDFGKTELANRGLRDFKAGWGAVEVPLISSIIARTVPGHGRDRARHLLGEVIRRAPPVVCRAAGELLYEHFA